MKRRRWVEMHQPCTPVFQRFLNRLCYVVDIRDEDHEIGGKPEKGDTWTWFITTVRDDNPPINRS